MAFKGHGLLELKLAQRGKATYRHTMSANGRTFLRKVFKSFFLMSNEKEGYMQIGRSMKYNGIATVAQITTLYN